jgi:16S rRNA (guanine527-N7)-methyltransferase
VPRRSTASAVDAAARLRSGAQSLGVELEESHVTELLRFLDEIELWNERMNLVGPGDRQTLIDRHLVDSLAAVRLLRSLGDGLRIADVGSGAGLPGIPLAIALRPRETCLIEPRRKRASFLRNVRRALPALGLQVLEERAEDVAVRVENVGSFDAVVSRATLGDDALLGCAAPLLRDRGLLIAYRGPSDGDRDLSPPRSGFSRPSVHGYALREAHRDFRLDVWTRCFT